MARAGRGNASNTVKLEDDELFKEIGGQLDANFDYSQWQRTEGGKTTTKRRPPPPKARKTSRATTTSKTPFSVSVGGGDTPLGSADYTCKHGHHKQTVRKETVLEKADRHKKEEQRKILQLRIQHRKQTIAEYEKRRKELLGENIKLKTEIDKQESECHDEVKKLLRKYEKFRGGITTLNDKFMEELMTVKKARDKTRLQIQIDVASLQRQVDALDKKLKGRQSELHTLVNYKDKEYPVKSLMISELQKQIEDLKVSNTEEEQELEHVVESELDKHKRQASSQEQNLTEDIMQKAREMMHPSLVDMATHNAVMEKEVSFHRLEVAELEAANEALDQEVKELLRSPKTNLRQQLFPHFFPTAEKCTPDMEVVLDIPTQDWLPI